MLSLMDERLLIMKIVCAVYRVMLNLIIKIRRCIDKCRCRMSWHRSGELLIFMVKLSIAIKNFLDNE